MPRYEHTQHGRFHFLLYALALLFVWLAWRAPGGDLVVVGALVMAAVMAFFALCFHRLTVRDEGEVLAIRYGPLPVFKRRIPYARMKAIELARSDWLDGFGIHYLPRRGWIYNLWGFDCVRLRLGKNARHHGTAGVSYSETGPGAGAMTQKFVRIGSDDTAALRAFLQSRVAALNPRAGAG